MNAMNMDSQQLATSHPLSVEMKGITFAEAKWIIP